MNTATTLTAIFKNKKIKEKLEKLDLGKNLNLLEVQFLLEFSLILLNEYIQDKRKTTFLELGYYIILKYSISYEEYEPLLEFSNAVGYYPIANELYKLNIVRCNRLGDFKSQIMIDECNNGKYIQTLQQKKQKSEILLNVKDENILFKAPTSFGKSEIISDCLKKFEKIVIIVPTKSLINQTYLTLKQSIKNYKYILHDSNYEEEDNYIMILTQERYSVILNQNKDLIVDLLIIDEAHNIFDSNNRSIILTRIIKESKRRINNIKLLFLSPLINDVKNLEIDNVSNIIKSYSINTNIKEPQLFLYEDSELKKYNRYINNFYNIINFEENYNYIDFIIKKSRDKNFIYFHKPRDIESFAIEFSKNLPDIKYNYRIEEMKKNLIELIGEEFYQVDLIDKGIIYLHAKIPDYVKKYLEYKFKNIKEIKYLVANSVVLEGINTEVDNMFILQTTGLDKKKLLNLIGRVNRLNTIFNSETNQLFKLMPKIFFVKTLYEKNSMKNKIKLLKSNVFTDELKNPLLKNAKNKNKKKNLIIKENNIENEKNEKRKKFLESGIEEFYLEEDITSIYSKLIDIKAIKNDKIEEVFELLYIIFIKDYKIKDNEVKRLRYKSTRKYYAYLISKIHSGNLKQLIVETKNYHVKKHPRFYIGESFGEIVYESTEYLGKKKVYIDISNKSDKEIYNIILVKLEIEKNYIQFKLRKFFELMYDFSILSETIYNEIVYGTDEEEELSLLKGGIDLSLLEILKRNDLLNFIEKDKYGNIYLRKDIKNEIFKLLDYEKFQLKNYIE